MALARAAIPSPNYSGRGGARVRLIVIHTAEGATTFQSLGNYFANPASKVSSQVGIDDTPGTVGEYVRRDFASWTQASFNGVATSAELCAFAAWTPATWAAHPTMLDNTRQWIAEEAAYFGIPIVKLSPAQAQDGITPGVCAHSDLGAAGGNHSDPGPGFPWADVLAGGVTPAPPPTEGGDMIANTSTGNGYWTATRDGAVYAFGDAKYADGVYGKLAKGTTIVGIAGKGTDGYRLLASDGGVFCFGSAGYYGRPDRV